MIEITQENFYLVRQMIASSFRNVSVESLNNLPDAPKVWIGEDNGGYMSVWEHPKGTYNLELV